MQGEDIVYSAKKYRETDGIEDQSVFWNIAYFDEKYFKGMFEDFVFPDGDSMRWESVSWLQKRFMNWFNEERRRAVLTFPVETVNLLDDRTKYLDEEWADFVAEMWSKGHSFFMYRSDNVDSLASCCRLRNEIEDNQFSYTLGAGGVSTGSKCVITINLNRLVQDAVREYNSCYPDVADNWAPVRDYICNKVDEQVTRVHKYLAAFNTILEDRRKAKLIPLYDAGFVSPERQYLTVGINGGVEAAEFLGCKIKPNDALYEDFMNHVLKTIYEANKRDRTHKLMYNCEFIPGENLGVKHAKWDTKAGYKVPRKCYNSYFYVVEDPTTSIVDKFILHGKKFTQYLDGGSALHANLDEHLTKSQYRKLMDIAIQTGCPYFTFNVPNTVCRDCGHISKMRLKACPKCGSTNLDYATRIIGYLKLVSSFSEARQEEEHIRYYANLPENTGESNA